MRTVKFLLSPMFLTILFSSLSSAVTPDRISSPINSTQLVELKGHISPLARPQDDQGPVEPSRTMHVTMLLLPTAAQQQALNQLLAQQQNVKSPNYHKWLTPQQFGESFGLSQDDLDKISAWLAGAGFKVTYVANGRDFLSFEGNASQVDSVFKTEIHYFDVNGKTHFANTKAPMIPAALAGIVGGFRGLHDFLPHHMHKPVPAWTQSGLTTHFLAPGDIATIYNINPLYNLSTPINGKGEKIVIAGQSDVYLADLNFYRNDFGISEISGCNMSTTTTGLIAAGNCTSGNFEMVVPGDGTDPGPVSGDLSESDLDIEIVSAVARGAEIIFVTSGSNGGVDDSANWAIDNDLAKVINYSYGLCEAFVTAPNIATQELIYQKVAGEGISFFAAAGDSASAECDGDNTTGTTTATEPAVLGQSVSYPASSPELTGVGGTEFDEGSGSYWGSSNGSDGGSATEYIPEIGWNDTNVRGVSPQFDGTGGGPSNCANGSANAIYGVPPNNYGFQVCNAPPSGGFTKPSWQSSVTPADGVRDVPDISFSASNVNDPYIVCTPESEIVSGSTSSTSTCANGISSALTSFSIPSAFGGTSAATPLAAATTLLLNQYLNANGLGTINQQLYTLFAANPAGVFNEIQPGESTTVPGAASNNIVTCTPGTPTDTTLPNFPAALQCPSGGTFGYSVAGGHAYSEVTGLGSLDVYKFFQAWAADQISFSTSATALSPASISAGNSTTSTVTVAAKNTYSGTVTYAFSCSGLPSGATCSFSPATVTGSGSTTMTIKTLPDMATGTSSVTVTATSGGVSESASTLSLTVTATTVTFTAKAANPTYQVTPGSTATVTINLSSSTGFITGSGANAVTVEPVVYTCTDNASESTCTGPLNSTTATSVSFTVTTTAPSARLLRPFDHTRFFYAVLLPGILGIAFTFGSRRRSLKGMKMLGLILVLGFSTLWLGSCGGGNNSSSSNPGTPAGSYTITVNAATTGANPLTAKAPFTLQVQ